MSEILLLVLRVAALILLAVSFARPYFAGMMAPASMPLTVIAVDTSMSMTAPGQFARARDAAAKSIGQSGPAGDSRGPERFFDGKVFDPANPGAYLASQPIKKLA